MDYTNTAIQASLNDVTLPTNNGTPPTTFITEEGAAALMELLLQRHSFHNDPPLTLHGNTRYIWPRVLLHEIEQFINTQQHNGKVQLSLVQQQFGVSLETLGQILPKEESATNFVILGHYPHQQLWTREYLQTSLKQLWLTVDQSKQPLHVSHVAKSMWQLPLDTTLELIREHVDSNDIELRTMDNGTPVLLGPVYRTELQRSVLEYLRASVSAPTAIRTVCVEQHWEVSWVLSILQQNINSLPGVLHNDDTYIPHQYKQQQQQAAVELFQTVGVVTDAKHSLHQLMEWLSPYQPVTLSHALVHRVLICHPLEVALQDADVLDLQPYVPSSLSLEDGRLLLQHVAPKDSTFVWNGNGGLFLSSSMMTSFLQQTMPLLIQEYAQERAQQLDAEYGASVILDSVLLDQKDRKQSHKKKNNAVVTMDYGTVPVERVIQRIRQQYCDELSLFENDFFEDTTAWNEICTMAFLSSDLHIKQCQNAIHAELERLSKRTCTAAPTGNIPAEFERTECFAYACYLVQLWDQFIQYAKDGGMEDSSVLQNECLQGPCAELTWRITQYCLFRNNVIDDDGEAFSFGTSTDSCYYKPVDMAVRSFHSMRLNCGTAKDPLAVLRQRLPGTDGVSLSRLWILCGKNSTVDEFRVHVQENCLPLIGLPYKIIDKKSEKKFLSARRDILLQRIQFEQDPAFLLDYTIMLLYQQVKNLVVSGSLLRGPILRLLTKERKITSEVASDLMSLAETLEKREVAESDLLERVRNCALKKK